jgi:hypothetical protein
MNLSNDLANTIASEIRKCFSGWWWGGLIKTGEAYEDWRRVDFKNMWLVVSVKDNVVSIETISRLGLNNSPVFYSEDLNDPKTSVDSMVKAIKQLQNTTPYSPNVQAAMFCSIASTVFLIYQIVNYVGTF